MGFMESEDITIINLTKLLSNYKKPIWVWTGYKFEDIVAKYKHYDVLQDLEAIQVIIDGKFEIKNKDLNLLYKGSSNQRVIDVRKSIKLDQTILYDI